MISSAVILLICAGITAGQSIISPPSNTTGIVGQTVKLECEVMFGPIDSMKWKFNENTLYSYYDEDEDYFGDTQKYSVRYQGGHFTLLVKNIDYSDAGIYHCAVSLESTSAVLVVLGIPDISMQSPIAIEGHNAIYMCNATIGGPRKKQISARHYPSLSMFLNGDILEGNLDIEEIHYDLPLIYYNLKQVSHISLTTNLHDALLTCEIGTSVPLVNINESYTLNILYPVSNVSYSPMSNEYEVGMFINCTSDGNPSPHIHWKDISATGTRMTTTTQLLNITEEMKGRNSWMCSAQNIINGDSHNHSIIADFDVVAAGGPPNSGNYNLLIASGVPVVLTIVLIGIIIGVVIFRDRRKKKKVPTATLR